MTLSHPIIDRAPGARLLLAAVAIALASVPVAAHAQKMQINGAGSTLGAPLYSQWAQSSTPSTGVQVNYQAIGSGAGISQIDNHTVDFGASDMPLQADELSRQHLMQFPTAIGGVDIIVNVPGVTAGQLKLTGPLIADIYLGKITHWNDPQLTALNPGLTLPHLAIAPVYRADGSGTTYVFTNYLDKVSPAWKSQVGSATDVKWPVGNGAKGSDGVAATVKQIVGSITYVESAYATQSHLTTALLRNAAGKFVGPSMQSFKAAAEAADWTKAPNFAVDLNDEPGAASWPIESATFILVPTQPQYRAQSDAVVKFFDWSFTHGDAMAEKLQYIPLPDAVHREIEAAWKTQKFASVTQ
jgi:phosphate transport system substrate-binding protein